MNGPRLPRRLGWLLAVGSALAAVLGGLAGQAAAAPEATMSGGGSIKVCGCVSFIAADSATSTLWLVNSRAKSITVVSEKTRKVVARINLGSQPGENIPVDLVFDPVSRTAWVFTGNIVKISDKTMKVVRYRMSRGFRGAYTGVVDPVRGEIWALSERTVQGLSESTGKVLQTVYVNDGVKVNGITGLAADPVSGTVFVSADTFQGARSWLMGIDEASGQRSILRTFPQDSFGVVADPARGKVWILRGTSLNAVSTAGQHKPAGSITFDPARLGSIAEDPTTGTIWMSARNAPELTRFSESHRNVIKTLPLPGPSPDVTVDTKSHTVFTLDSQHHVVRFYRY